MALIPIIHGIVERQRRAELCKSQSSSFCIVDEAAIIAPASPRRRDKPSLMFMDG
jgi:hypothetical protein